SYGCAIVTDFSKTSSLAPRTTAARAATESLVASQQAGRAPGLVHASETQKACASRRFTRSVRGEVSGLHTGTLSSAVRLRRAARTQAFIVSERRARS